MNDKKIGNEKNILFYNDEEGNTKIEVLLENEDVWLNTEALATLFNVKRPAITKHINNIYDDGELEEKSTCSKMEHVVLLSNSPLLYILFRCLVMAGRLVPNRLAICSWVSQTVSCSNLTSNLTSSSG